MGTNRCSLICEYYLRPREPSRVYCKATTSLCDRTTSSNCHNSSLISPQTTVAPSNHMRLQSRNCKLNDTFHLARRSCKGCNAGTRVCTAFTFTTRSKSLCCITWPRTTSSKSSALTCTRTVLSSCTSLTICWSHTTLNRRCDPS